MSKLPSRYERGPIITLPHAGVKPKRIARLDVLICLLIAVIGVPAAGAGQWLRYPTADVPRTPDDDPKVYTRPFTVTTTQNIELDTELVDEFCLENEKSYERMQRSRGK